MPDADRDRFFVRPKPGGTAVELRDSIMAWIDAIRSENGLPPLTDDGEPTAEPKPKP